MGFLRVVAPACFGFVPLCVPEGQLVSSGQNIVGQHFGCLAERERSLQASRLKTSYIPHAGVIARPGERDPSF